jgi:hypothetical protein
MTDNREHLIDFDAYVKDLTAPGTFSDVVSDPDCEIKKADVLLLTCMDFRFFLEIAERMRNVKYDHVILAGAALGAVWHEKPGWHEMFFDHLGLALKLHQVERVIVMEHRNCGAYGPRECGGFGLLEPNPDPKVERDVHEAQVAELKVEVRARYPRLGFADFLLDKPNGTDALTFDQLI